MNDHSIGLQAVRLSTPTPDKTIDLSGMRCPHLVIATMEALRAVEPGQVLRVIATDLNSPSNMTAWSRQSGHPILDIYAEDDHFVIFFERGHVRETKLTKDGTGFQEAS